MDKNMMTNCPTRMREVFAFLLLIAASPVLAQEDCDNIVTIPELASQIQEVQVATIIMLSEGTYEVQLSNGNIYNLIMGCMDDAYDEYNAEAVIDDGSCTSLLGCTDAGYAEYNADAVTDDGSCASLLGCTDSAYLEYNAAAGSDDGSCATLLGCTDSAYLEYNAAAGSDDGSCSTLLGCTDSAYLEYNAAAGADDGSCTTLVVNGCTDSAYDEYNASANTDDGSCATLLGCTDSAYLEYNAAAGSDDGSCATLLGCTDSAYLEYNAAAGSDDGSCSTLLGCTDSAYLEYNAAAGSDDGSCSTLLGCTDSAYLEYNAAAESDDGSCATLLGCTDSAYLEYNAAAGSDDGSCTTPVVNGCTDPAYDEYNAYANTDDGSCATISGCTDSAYLEYNAAANTDDGSCATPWCSNIEFDGYEYEVVQIGDQCWFAENLRTTVYADGSGIPDVPASCPTTWCSGTDEAWSGLSTGARGDYVNNLHPDAATNLANYGRLYNWYAVDDARGLCPSGWHVPSDEEWDELEDYVGANGHNNDEGIALRSTSELWTDSNLGIPGTDDFGFSALPGGQRNQYSGAYSNARWIGYWWTSTNTNTSGGSSSPYNNKAWYRYIRHNLDGIYSWEDDPRKGYSVRCLRYGW